MTNIDRKKIFKFNLKNNRGLTLVEAMVTAMIFALIAGGVYTAGIAGERSWQANKVQVELQQDLRKAMEWMIKDLRITKSSAILDVPADDIWYSSITFKLWFLAIFNILSMSTVNP